MDTFLRAISSSSPAAGPAAAPSGRVRSLSTASSVLADNQTTTTTTVKARKLADGSTFTGTATTRPGDDRLVPVNGRRVFSCGDTHEGTFDLATGRLKEGRAEAAKMIYEGTFHTDVAGGDADGYDGNDDSRNGGDDFGHDGRPVCLLKEGTAAARDGSVILTGSFDASLHALQCGVKRDVRVGVVSRGHFVKSADNHLRLLVGTTEFAGGANAFVGAYNPRDGSWVEGHQVSADGFVIAGKFNKHRMLVAGTSCSSPMCHQVLAEEGNAITFFVGLRRPPNAKLLHGRLITFGPLKPAVKYLATGVARSSSSSSSSAATHHQRGVLIDAFSGCIARAHPADPAALATLRATVLGGLGRKSDSVSPADVTPLHEGDLVRPLTADASFPLVAHQGSFGARPFGLRAGSKLTNSRGIGNRHGPATEAYETGLFTDQRVGGSFVVTLRGSRPGASILASEGCFSSAAAGELADGYQATLTLAAAAVSSPSSIATDGSISSSCDGGGGTPSSSRVPPVLGGVDGAEPMQLTLNSVAAVGRCGTKEWRELVTAGDGVVDAADRPLSHRWVTLAQLLAAEAKDAERRKRAPAVSTAALERLADTCGGPAVAHLLSALSREAHMDIERCFVRGDAHCDVRQRRHNDGDAPPGVWLRRLTFVDPALADLHGAVDELPDLVPVAGAATAFVEPQGHVLTMFRVPVVVADVPAATTTTTSHSSAAQKPQRSRSVGDAGRVPALPYLWCLHDVRRGRGEMIAAFDHAACWALERVLLAAAAGQGALGNEDFSTATAVEGVSWTAGENPPAAGIMLTLKAGRKLRIYSTSVATGTEAVPDPSGFRDLSAIDVVTVTLFPHTVTIASTTFELRRTPLGVRDALRLPFYAAAFLGANLGTCAFSDALRDDIDLPCAVASDRVARYRAMAALREIAYLHNAVPFFFVASSSASNGGCTDDDVNRDLSEDAELAAEWLGSCLPPSLVEFAADPNVVALDIAIVVAAAEGSVGEAIQDGFFSHPMVQQHRTGTSHLAGSSFRSPQSGTDSGCATPLQPLAASRSARSTPPPQQHRDPHLAARAASATSTPTPSPASASSSLPANVAGASRTPISAFPAAPAVASADEGITSSAAASSSVTVRFAAASPASLAAVQHAALRWLISLDRVSVPAEWDAGPVPEPSPQAIADTCGDGVPIVSSEAAAPTAPSGGGGDPSSARSIASSAAAAVPDATTGTHHQPQWLTPAERLRAVAATVGVHLPRDLQMPMWPASSPVAASDPHGLQLLRFVPPRTHEFAAVMLCLNANCGSVPFTSTHRVICVQRVQNPALWDRYTQRVKAIAKENGGDANEVAWMKHGTRTTPPLTICTTGFDHRYCEAGMYGRATYFAYSSHYSNLFRHDVGGSREAGQMVLARVARGRVHSRSKHDAGLRHPGHGCHSVEGPVSSSSAGSSSNGGVPQRAVMTYDLNQAYPAYVVTYHVPEADRGIRARPIGSAKPAHTSSQR